METRFNNMTFKDKVLEESFKSKLIQDYDDFVLATETDLYTTPTCQDNFL